MRFLVLLLSAPILTTAMVAGYTVVGTLMQWPQATVTDAVVSGQSGHVLMLPEAPLQLAAIMVPFVALCVMAGMSWSLKSKGVLGAVVPTVGIIGAWSLAAGFCGHQMAAVVPLLGPVANSLSAATSMLMLTNPWVYVHGFADNPVFGRVLLFASAPIAAGGYSLVVYTILKGMVRSFDQTVRKLSGTG